MRSTGSSRASADVADDRMSVTFKLRPEAKFADGTPVTADDVVFSFNTLKEKGHPRLSMPLHDVTKAEALDPLTVRYTFQGDLVRDLPITVATAARSLQGVLHDARFREDLARAAARIGPLQDRWLQAWDVRHLPSPRGLLG